MRAAGDDPAEPAGTRGVGYLRKMLDVVLFPEIWRLRTDP
jgi:tryptophan 2,3-dioxygenase